MVMCVLWDIESLELDRRPLGPSALELDRSLLSNSQDSISHSAHMVIVYPIPQEGH